MFTSIRYVMLSSTVVVILTSLVVILQGPSRQVQCFKGTGVGSMTYALVHLDMVNEAQNRERRLENDRERLIESMVDDMKSTIDNPSGQKFDAETVCKNELKTLTNIRQYRAFLADLKQIKDKLKVDKHAMTGGGKSPSAKLLRCINEYNSLRELGIILANDGDVCKPEHISKLINYHINYMEVSPLRHLTSFPGTKHRFLARHFFVKYVFRVSQTCRKNVFDHIREADKHFTDDEMYQVLIWRKPKATKKVHEEQAAQLTESIVNLEELEFLAPRVDHYEVIPVLTLGENIYKVARKTQKKCQKYRRYFGNIVLSVLRLANHGYKWHFGVENEQLTNDQDAQLMKKWLAITYACIPQLFVRYKRESLADKLDDTFKAGGDIDQPGPIKEGMIAESFAPMHVNMVTATENYDDDGDNNQVEYPDAEFQDNHIDPDQLLITADAIKQAQKHRADYDHALRLSHWRYKIVRFFQKLTSTGPAGSQSFWKEIDKSLMQFLNPKSNVEKSTAQWIVTHFIAILGLCSALATVGVFLYSTITTGAFNG